MVLAGKKSVSFPNAELFAAVVFDCREPLPTAVLSAPELFADNDSRPTAVFPSATVVPKAFVPTAVL